MLFCAIVPEQLKETKLSQLKIFLDYYLTILISNCEYFFSNLALLTLFLFMIAISQWWVWLYVVIDSIFSIAFYHCLQS